MVDFQIKIDYNNFDFDNSIGNGKNGEVYDYNGFIIKKENIIDDINYDPLYSEKNPYQGLKCKFIKEILNYYKMSKVVNNLKHFVKIKGLVIFPNIYYEYGTKIFYSVLYENAGKLQRNILPYDKINAFQLLDICKSFTQFNLAGFFHKDIQGCNNIEYNEKNQLYVIDYDVDNYKDNDEIKLNILLIDITKFFTCIEYYKTNNATNLDENKYFNLIVITIMTKYLEKKNQLYWMKKLKRLMDFIIKNMIII